MPAPAESKAAPPRGLRRLPGISRRRKTAPRCERRPVRTAPVTVLAVLAVLGLLGGILAVVCRKVPAAGICWAAAALAAGLAYDIGKGRKNP